MKNLRLTIDLLPKGAWGNDFSKTLPKKDWDMLRNFCYEKAKHRCAICGYADAQLGAHEVWDFDSESKTQTLKDIIALCSACHGVKHMRNSERIGYGENAKRHFIKVNNCDALTLAKHYTDAQFLFDARNKVLRWKIIADLDKFGGHGIEVKERDIPLVVNPYENIDWETVDDVIAPNNSTTTLESELGDRYIAVTLKNKNIINGTKADAKYFSSQVESYIGTPKIQAIEVDNYQGAITVTSDYTNKIQWLLDNEIIKTKYNIAGNFINTFSVEDLEGEQVRFILVGYEGQTCSQAFELTRDTV